MSTHRRSELVVLVGPAGAGKSSWARTHATTPTEVVSLDTLRGWVSDDPADQSATADAVTLARLLVAARLRRGLRVIVDSTATEPAHRLEWAHLARRADATATLTVFTTPLQVCLDRNRQRPGPAEGRRWGIRVPDPVVRAQHAATTRLVTHLQAGGTVPGYHHTQILPATTGTTRGEGSTPTPEAIPGVATSGYRVAEVIAGLYVTAALAQVITDAERHLMTLRDIQDHYTAELGDGPQRGQLLRRALHHDHAPAQQSTRAPHDRSTEAERGERDRRGSR